jgi:hypothetical protein
MPPVVFISTFLFIFLDLCMGDYKEGERTIRNIRNKRIKEKRPAQRIQQSLLELIYFEMFVSHTLVVYADAFDSEDPVFGT